ncbi:hypothetical protein F511_37910 [Dorcoceras hygrometricum]|uniref:Uncharacterized protein n=1 Tax=Dorcoceras hygrometricum TaxID=472368 RepID=A0A2Z7CHW1_9LAMI|nr:hypothetical protein F511_37910 [Dorcoceras hygrometricum]
MHAADKENRSSRPANQLAVNLNRASIPAQCINRGNHLSVIIRPVSHHSSADFRHNQSVGHHSDDSIVPFGHDTSVACNNVALSQILNRSMAHFKEMGIDQLGFQSVQLGYLKILQLGTQTQTIQTQEKEYEVKPQPANQLAVNLNRASIPAQCINRGNHRSVIIRPVSHHSSADFRHNQSVGHHSDDSIVPFGHDTSVACNNVALSQILNRSMAQYVCMNAMKFKSDFNMYKIRTSLKLKSRSSHAQESTLLNCHENTPTHSFFAFPLQRLTGLPNWYQSKELLTTSSAPPILLQTTTEIDAQAEVDQLGEEKIGSGRYGQDGRWGKKLRAQKFSREGDHLSVVNKPVRRSEQEQLSTRAVQEQMRSVA